MDTQPVPDTTSAPPRASPHKKSISTRKKAKKIPNPNPPTTDPALPQNSNALGQLPGPEKPSSSAAAADDTPDADAIYVVEDKANIFEQNGPLLAGYIGFSKTGELWDFVRSDPVKDILASYQRHRKADFLPPSNPNDTQTSLKKAPSVQKTRVFDALRDPTLLPYLSRSEDLELDSNVHATSYGNLVWANTIHRIVTLRSDVFTTGSYAIISMEDYSRAYWLIRWWWKQTSVRRQTKKTPRSEAAVLPRYSNQTNPGLEATTSTIVDGQPAPDLATRFAAAEASMPSGQIGMDEFLDLNPSEPILNDFLADDPDVWDNLGRVMDSQFLTSTKADAQIRPDIEPEARLKVLEILADAVTVLHDEKRRQSSTTQAFVTAAGAYEEIDEPDADDNADGEDVRRRAFWRLQRRLNQTPGSEPTFEEASSYLGLSLDNTRMEIHPALVRHPNAPNPLASFELKVWQIVGIRYILRQESSPIGGGIVADDCGLGKTIQMLAAITYDATRHAADHQHRPTLIIVPPGVLDTWVQEWRRYFSNVLTLHLFHGSSEQSRSTVRQGLILNQQGFTAKMRSLDPADPKTSATVILTTYPTWANRSVAQRVVTTTDDDEYMPDADDEEEVQESDADSTVCTPPCTSFDYSQ